METGSRRRYTPFLKHVSCRQSGTLVAFTVGMIIILVWKAGSLYSVLCGDNQSSPVALVYGERGLEVPISSWEHRKVAIDRAFRHRDAALGEALLPSHTGNGDIASAGTYDQIRAYSDWAAQPWVKTVCEVGFATASSTIVYLESNPHLRVVAFDLMTIPGNASQQALAFVSARYGGHRITIVEGDSQRTLTEYQRFYGELCDIISVDGAHDTQAYADFAQLRWYANPTRHVLLADDCVSRTVYEKVKLQRPNVMWFGGVWDSWRRIVDEEAQVREKATYVYGGEDEPWIEPFSGCLKGWCEGEYAFVEVSQEY